ncbi:MAG: Lrp/AsnC family transcriptional regulator [Candidatus Bathyarchaeota archaeon]|jgi:DNA-binding Lrp family transcriptional regulator
MSELTDVDYKIISSLMKNARMSDRQLAKEIGVSQPTVTRRRTKLEKEGYLEYTAIPNLPKLGYDIMVFNFSKWTPDALTRMLPRDDFGKQVRLFLSNHPNVIFGSTGGTGLNGMNATSISFHKNYTEYSDWTKEIESVWGDYVKEFDRFIISLKSANIVRQITFKFLSDHLQQARKNKTTS